MDAYVYQAAMICESCAEHIIDETVTGTLHLYHDEMPSGPNADGGGEGDSPQHCDLCGCFLENPLTNTGYRELLEYFQNFVDGVVPCPPLETLREYFTFYKDDWVSSEKTVEDCVPEFVEAMKGFK